MMFCNFCRDCCRRKASDFRLPVPLKGKRNKFIMPVSKQHRTHSFLWYKPRGMRHRVTMVRIMVLWKWIEMKWNDAGHKCKINFKQSCCSKFGPEQQRKCTVVHRSVIESEQLDMIFVTLNLKHIQLCVRIHRWCAIIMCYVVTVMRTNIYLLQYIEKWTFLVSSDTHTEHR